jgi:hypothetical protein
MPAKKKRQTTPSLLAAARSRRPGAARGEADVANVPHRGDADERKGRGGAATRGRGGERRGAKRPSRSKD